MLAPLAVWRRRCAPVRPRGGAGILLPTLGAALTLIPTRLHALPHRRPAARPALRRLGPPGPGLHVRRHADHDLASASEPAGTGASGRHVHGLGERAEHDVR